MLCVFCGDRFIQPRKDAVYCGKRCRDLAYKKRKMGSRPKKMRGIDLSGETFGRLKVIKRTDERYNTFVVYDCLCSCGQQTKAHTGSLKSGMKQSCGCLEIENRNRLNENFGERLKKHGGRKTAAYKSWISMKSRCSNPDEKNYFGKGIEVCDEWESSFEAFLSDMGNPPPGGSIDRIDNSKGYFKENCRWASNKEQCRNRTNNVYVKYNGVIMTVAEYAEKMKMSWSGANKKSKRDGIYIGRISSGEDAMIKEREK